MKQLDENWELMPRKINIKFAADSSSTGFVDTLVSNNYNDSALSTRVNEMKYQFEENENTVLEKRILSGLESGDG